MSDKPISEKIKDLESLSLFVEQIGNQYRFFNGKKNSNNPYWAALFGRINEAPNLYSPREIAKIWKSYFGKGSKWKELVKTIGNGKDRARTRALISQEDFDKIPLGERVDRDDEWNYS